MTSPDEQVKKSIDAAWRIEAPRLIGGLVRLLRDVSLAEDLAHEALLVALERWPAEGIPRNPGAWLMTTAKNRALDQLRHRRMRTEKENAMAHELSPESWTPEEDEGDGDDTLRLMLIACHPVLSSEARVALTLRLLGGLTTGEIARAFLVSEATIAQRIVRAKRTLSEARAAFESPKGQKLVERVPSVLDVLYLIFNEGYAAASGDDWMRPELCQDAMRLGRMLAALLPEEVEVHGLLALMELQASRMRARQDKQGNPVLLLDQSRAQWDRTLIQHGLGVLDHAFSLGSPLGPFTLQAAIAACHARAARAEDTDWVRIVALYDALAHLTNSPVVELNRAVAVGMAYGPEEGLNLVDALVRDGSLAQYHLLSAVRGDLLARLGRAPEARGEFERAAGLTHNLREKATLLARARSLSSAKLLS